MELAMVDNDERTRLIQLSHSLDRLKSPCQLCGKRGSIGSTVDFSSNFGIGFRRAERHMSGEFCGPCIHKNFVLFTVVNLFGWFGIVSMIKAPYFLLSNCDEYFSALRLMWKRRKHRNAMIEDLLRKNATIDKS
jgi:hypothetical protein